MNKTGRQNAFTLIELLVVIAIIAMLLAVIMPSLAKAKMFAKRIVSSSNMRQIGIAMTMYADDNKGFFPETTHTVSFDKSWIYSLSPYLSKMDKVRICPADPQKKERLESNSTSYIFNEYLTVRYQLGRLINSESFNNLNKLKRANTTITVFVASDRWSAADVNADHTHSRTWFVSSRPEDRWSAIRSDIQVDRYRTRSPNEDNTKGSTLLLYADTRVEPVRANKIKEMSDNEINFAKPK